MVSIKKNIVPSLEICCYSAESVIQAGIGGADRVELCDSMQDGGTTPSEGTIVMARKVQHVQLYVIVRPRGGDFCYNNIEFEVMKQDVIRAKELGADGVVIGLLNSDGTVDVNRTKVLVELAQPLDVTFHRAFDMTADPYSALEDVCSCGITRILTSGTYNTALEGIEVLRKLIKQARGRVDLMAGSGVDVENMTELFIAGIRHFHSSASKRVQTVMQYKNPNIKMGKESQQSEFEKTIVDVEKVRAMKIRLHHLLEDYK